MQKRNCTIRVVKTKVLISCAVTAQLICAFVFTYAKLWFSQDAANVIKLRFLTKSDIIHRHVLRCLLSKTQLYAFSLKKCGMQEELDKNKSQTLRIRAQ